MKSCSFDVNDLNGMLNIVVVEIQLNYCTIICFLQQFCVEEMQKQLRDQTDDWTSIISQSHYKNGPSDRNMSSKQSRTTAVLISAAKVFSDNVM